MYQISNNSSFIKPHSTSELLKKAEVLETQCEIFSKNVITDVQLFSKIHTHELSKALKEIDQTCKSMLDILSSIDFCFDPQLRKINQFDLISLLCFIAGESRDVSNDIQTSIPRQENLNQTQQSSRIISIKTKLETLDSEIQEVVLECRELSQKIRFVKKDSISNIHQ